MKAYTNIEQSKKLSEILPLESADMHYSKDFDGSWFVDLAKYTSVKIPKYVVNIEEHLLPCWSLAALLKLMPKIGAHEPMLRKLYYTSEPTERYICQYSLTDMTSEYDNPVDACYEMILKLHELKML